MKYHNNMKTILITCFVVLLFLSVSVFLLVALRLTSPTMIITDRLMKSISEVDSDFSLEFEGLERNFRDRVMLNNLSLYYKGEEFASFEKIEVKLGLFDAIAYIMNLGGSAEVNFRDGIVMLPDSFFEKSDNTSGISDAETDSPDISLSSFLSSHNITLSFNNTSLSTPYGEGTLDELYLSYLGSEETLVGEVKSSSLSLSYSGYDVTLLNPFISFSYGESVYLDITLSGLSASGDGLSLDVNNLNVSGSAAALSDAMEGVLNAKLSTESISGEYRGNSVSVEDVSFIWAEERKLSGRMERISAFAPTYSLSLESVYASFSDFNSYSLTVGDISGSVASLPVNGNGLSIDGKVEEKSLSFILGKVSSQASKYTKNSLSGVNISSLEGSLGYSDGLSLAFSLDATCETVSRRIDDISFSLDAALNVKDEKITSSSVRIDNLYLGYGEKYSSLLSVTGDLDRAVISLDYGSFDIDLTASFNRKTLEGSVNIDSLSLPDAVPLFLDSEIAFFNEKSLLSLSSAFDLSFDPDTAKVKGDLDYSFSIGALKLAFVESSFSSEGRLTLSDDTVLIHDITLGTSYFDMDCTGSFDLRQFLPTLDFSACLKNGKEILNGYIHLGENRSYSFYADFTAVRKTYLTGSVDFSENDLVTSSSILETNGKERPFSLIVNLESRVIDIISDSLSVTFDYSDGIRGKAVANTLETFRSDDGRSLVLDGELDVIYSLSEGLSLSSSTIEVRDIFLLPASPSLSFRVTGSNDRIRLDDINVRFSDNTLYTGAFSLDFESNSAVFALDEDGGDGEILFSLYRDSEFVAVLKADAIGLSVLGLDNMTAHLNLYGRAARIEDFSFTGSLDITSPDGGRRAMNADITIDGTSLVLRDVEYSSEDVSAQMSRLYLDATAGLFGIESFSFRLENRKAARDYPLQGEITLSGEMEKGESLYSSILSLVRGKGEGVTARFSIVNLDLDSSLFVVSERYCDITVDGRRLTLSGNFLSGEIEKETLSGYVSVDLPGLAVASFTFSLSSSLEAKADIEEFNMGLVNLLMEYPTIVFRDDLVGGEVSLTRNESGEFSMNGALHADELGVDVFWIEDQTLILHNASFIIWDNVLSSSFTYVTVYDKLTSERRMVRMNVAVAMSETLSLESWEVDVYIDEDNPVRVRIPLPLIGIDILGYVTGHYYAYSDSNGMDNDGTLNLTDTVVSVGMNPYPKWYDEIYGATFLNLTFNFGKNNRVLYPAGDDPIFSIDLQENSSVYAYMGSDGSYSFTGDIQVRGGEIFYFQKYFYITSGSISFDDPNYFNPKINLRATLRDYTSSSEKVEIYLVLKDNTFDNLSPTLESSPVMELSEIMEILGQSILPQSTYGSVSVSSVASLVTEGFDILSRLGIVTSGNPLSSLSSSLKSVFGVDSFSLHSNILNNIVADTISQATKGTAETYSPMARFLNGTTLNVGKYLSRNLYMQAMVHLEATGDRKSYTIISDDLALDTEFSLEWTNSAFNVTFFTRPSYFSFDSLFSTFGFSITKTMNF